MLIHSPSARNKVEQPEIVPPNLQLAAGSAPVLLNAKTYVPKAPVSAVTPAAVLRKVAPTYPVGVRMTGTVLATATIQKDGRVASLRATGGNPVLRAAAMRAIQQWAFRPALLNGQPVESSLEIKVDFSGAR
jgi:protein TonB